MDASKPNADILFEGGDILTLDKNRPYFRNGAVAVSGDRILAVGTSGEVRSEIGSASRTIDFSHQILMPGLIDCHTHLGESIGKTLGDGLTLLPWLSKFMFPLICNVTREDAVRTAKMASLGSVLSGTTTLLDSMEAPVDEETVIGAAEAVQEVGARGAIARGIYGPMSEGGRRMECDPRLFQYSVQEEIEITRACLKAKPRGSLVEIWPMPQNTAYVVEELLVASNEIALEYDVSWQVHCSEAEFEVDLIEDMYGKKPVNWLHDLGILNDRAQLAHGIWLDDDEIALMGEANAHVIHNPICNQYVASGIIKLDPLMRAGANVALGSDGKACVGSNMFEVMKAAQLLQRLREYQADATTSELMLCMATRNGGKMLRKNVGVLKQDALADMIVIDLNGARHQPSHRTVCNVTLSATGSDVRHVMVNGEVVVENGKSTRVDQDKLVADCIQASGDLLDRAGIRDLAVDWIEPERH